MSNHEAPHDAARRQVVKFSFYRIDPAWRALPDGERARGKREFAAVVSASADRLQVRSYSVVGMRGDVDFLLWQIGDRLDDVQELASGLLGTGLGPYLAMPHSYLAMTRRSVYVSGEEGRERLELRPADSRYFFVYPFVKTREWYQLGLDERQKMMDQHITIGRKYPSVKLNTTYSFGLDDQEFVVSFETDEPADFLDLVMELREARTSLYTLRDTPIFSCIAMNLAETLDTLDGGRAGVELNEPLSGEGVEWSPVVALSEIPPGSSKVIYFEREQVALFNVDGLIHAVDNRCSHANNPLSDGEVKGTVVTCPYHDSQFDLCTGQPLRPPANRALRTYRVRVEGGLILLAAQEADAVTRPPA